MNEMKLEFKINEMEEEELDELNNLLDELFGEEKEGE